MMKIILTFLLFLLRTQNLCSQIDSAKFHGPMPRTGPHAMYPGHYELVARINNAIVDRSEYLVVEIFLTGYGHIENSKLTFYPAIDVIDTKTSTISFDFSSLKTKTGASLKWGSQTVRISGAGVLLDFQPFNDLSATYFLDYNTKGGTSPQILTETSLGGNAPVALNLRIRNNASPGVHFLNLAFTYFNGIEWLGDNQQIHFTIQNTFQKNNTLISILVVIATIFTILSSIFIIYELITKRKTK